MKLLTRCSIGNLGNFPIIAGYSHSTEIRNYPLPLQYGSSVRSDVWELSGTWEHVALIFESEGKFQIFGGAVKLWQLFL